MNTLDNQPHYLLLTSNEAMSVVDRDTVLGTVEDDMLDPAIEECGWCGYEENGKRFAIVALGAGNETLQQALAFVSYAA